MGKLGLVSISLEKLDDIGTMIGKKKQKRHKKKKVEVR